MNDLKGIIEDCNKSDLVSDKIIKKIIEIIGQEEWQDLHDENNDICTTMGELIITLKGIEELEKENAELDCQKNRNKFCYSCANAEDRCFRNEIGCPCGKYKSYKDENAELKRGYHYEVEVINGKPTGKAILISDSLAYAKSIIEQLMNMKNLSDNELIEVIKKAKAFLH